VQSTVKIEENAERPVPDSIQDEVFGNYAPELGWVG